VVTVEGVLGSGFGPTTGVGVVIGEGLALNGLVGVVEAAGELLAVLAFGSGTGPSTRVKEKGSR
jgi:hypothetical protein